MSSGKAVDRNDSQEARSRLVQIIKLLSMSRAAFARRIVYSEGYIHHVARKGGSPVKRPLAETIERELGFSADWIMHGRGPMRIAEEGAAEYKLPTAHADSGDMRIPIERTVYDCRRCLGEVKRPASTCPHCGQELVWPPT